jgi:hypothetical protein
MVFENHNCGFFIAFHWACAQWFDESPLWGFEGIAGPRGRFNWAKGAALRFFYRFSSGLRPMVLLIAPLGL